MLLLRGQKLLLGQMLGVDYSNHHAHHDGVF